MSSLIYTRYGNTYNRTQTEYDSITTWIINLDFTSYPNILPQSQHHKVEIMLKLSKSSFW
jgi:hypothetical protein